MQQTGFPIFQVHTFTAFDASTVDFVSDFLISALIVAATL